MVGDFFSTALIFMISRFSNVIFSAVFRANDKEWYCLFLDVAKKLSKNKIYENLYIYFFIY